MNKKNCGKQAGDVGDVVAIVVIIVIVLALALPIVLPNLLFECICRTSLYDWLIFYDLDRAIDGNQRRIFRKKEEAIFRYKFATKAYRRKCRCLLWAIIREIVAAVGIKTDRAKKIRPMSTQNSTKRISRWRSLSYRSNILWEDFKQKEIKTTQATAKRILRMKSLFYGQHQLIMEK